MSANFSSIQIRTDARNGVKRVIHDLSRKQKRKFLIGPDLGGWIGVYPEWCDVTKLCRAIARRLSAELFLLVVQYDDIPMKCLSRSCRSIQRPLSWKSQALQ